MFDHVTIQWRVKAEKEIAGIVKGVPAGEWTDYKQMRPADAEEFLKTVNGFHEGRTCFSYRIKPGATGP